jgi:hypothetical protein
VDSPRNKDKDVNSFNIQDRDANGIINSESAVKSDIVLRYRMENSDHTQIRPIFHEGAR